MCTSFNISRSVRACVRAEQQQHQPQVLLNQADTAGAQLPQLLVQPRQGPCMLRPPLLASSCRTMPLSPWALQPRPSTCDVLHACSAQRRWHRGSRLGARFAACRHAHTCWGSSAEHRPSAQAPTASRWLTCGVRHPCTSPPHARPRWLDGSREAWFCAHRPLATGPAGLPAPGRRGLALQRLPLARIVLQCSVYHQLAWCPLGEVCPIGSN